MNQKGGNKKINENVLKTINLEIEQLKKIKEEKKNKLNECNEKLL